VTKKKLASIYQHRVGQLVELIKKTDPEKIILFGSSASGKINLDSDIDLCVIKKTKNPWRVKDKISDLLWQADYDWRIEPDIKVYPLSLYDDWLSRNDPFIKEIEKGKVLYEKG